MQISMTVLGFALFLATPLVEHTTYSTNFMSVHIYLLYMTFAVYYLFISVDFPIHQKKSFFHFEKFIDCEPMW